MPKQLSAIILSLALALWQPLVTVAQTPAQPSLAQLVNERYLALLERAATVKFSAQEFEHFRQQLEREKQHEQKRLEQEEQQLKRQVEQMRKQLDVLNKQASHDSEAMATERRQLHCSMLKLENQLREKKTAREQGVPVAYDNKRAKLDLLQQWPAKRQEIAQTLASGNARARRFGDVEDIGLRKVGEGQEKDVKLGQDAINEIKMYGLLPFEVEDKEIKTYVQQLADTIAVNSDLKIPVKVTVLDSAEINAFALPGGFFFINTGIIQKADNESELVGVMAHELAHVAARHGARLMHRATVANLVFQAAQIAAMIFTGGVVGIGTYYALQYGFFGLGLLLDLTLLGVSREYEAEADQLGVQYTWRAGYDPQGFITFFDKLASEQGYVTSASFFRTHPPFFERIFSTFSEIAYLPRKTDWQTDSSRFHQIKQRLSEVCGALQEERKKRPTLRRLPQCDEEPVKKPAVTTSSSCGN